MKLIKKIIIEGQIEALSGLTIGSSNTSMSIGGPDKVVIRNPISNLPYVPGSSLKGKMRSLLELSYGFVQKSDKGGYGPSENPEHITTKLFGAAKGGDLQRPSRLLFRDSEMANPDDFTNTDLPYTESKTEVMIDRITSAANPRTIERVPAGARFELSLVLNVFQDDDEQSLISLIWKGLQVIQDDYLGGSGSRGSGRVCFHISKVIERTAGFYHSGEKETNIFDSSGLPEDLK